MALTFLANMLSNKPSSASGEKQFGVDGFASEIGKNGVAAPSYFLVEITAPKKVAVGSTVERGMPLRIEQVSMPARTMMTFPQNYYGPPREIPYRYVSQPVTLTIILSEDMREREFFMQWQDLFVGSRRATDGPPTSGIYDCGYFKENVGTVTIKQYGTSPAFQGASASTSLLGDIKDAAEAFGFETSRITNPLGFNLFGLSSARTAKAIYEISLIEAYPINVNEIQMSWGEEGYAKLQVEMRYTYTIDKHPFADVAGASAKSFLRSAVESFQRFAPVFSLIKNQGISGAIRSTISSAGGGLVNAGKAAKSILPF